MQVIKAKHSGFCMGVSLALRKLDQAVEECGGASGRLATLGPIIHNPQVIRRYADKGVLCFEAPGEARPGDTVIIRAHGVTREVEEALRASGVLVQDATCPKVKRAQLAIEEQRAALGGGTLLLFGESEHPEVRGLVSYARGDAMVFGSLAELEGLELKDGRPYFLAAQTTQDQDAFQNIQKRLEERLNRSIPVLSTICDATRQRQAGVQEILEQIDALIVVGGHNSGNTRRLADLARHQSITALHLESPEELNPDLIKGYSRLGLTAGASTPAEHIEAMLRLLESL